MPEPIDAATSDPLSERTLRYRRNLLAICFVISILVFYSEITLEDASLFGVSIQGGDANSAIIIWTIITILLLYQFIVFLIYCRIDYNTWAIPIRNNHTPSLIMLFGISPPKFMIRRLGQYNPETETKMETAFPIKHEQNNLFIKII